MKVNFKRFCSDARVPEKATPGSACYDIFFARNVILEPNATKSVETDIGLKFSETYACSFYPRSGLSLKPVTLGGGVIDSDFRGIVCVILTNSSQEVIEIKKGGQNSSNALFEKRDVEFVEVDKLHNTERGIKDFGSTGK